MPRTPNYWQNKITLFLHDPVHKALRIPGHEARSYEIAGLLIQSIPEKDFYAAADHIAAGLTRAALPAFSKDENNGAVDFNNYPVLTHPLVKGSTLTFPKITSGIDDVHAALLKLLEDDIDFHKTYEDLRHCTPKPLSGCFDKNTAPEKWAQALYFYLFFAFKKRLRISNSGGLGSLWDLLPADTRMPDHSIWHHCGLTSAIGSAMASDLNNEVSLTVFSISPVQPFIAKARKLRDSWTASVLLSYLTFVGIREVMNGLGPDHIVYPSLHDQSLVESWIGSEFHLERFLKENDVVEKHSQTGKSIASFPNKFVFVCSTSSAAEITGRIKNAVQKEWERIAGMVREELSARSGAGSTFKEIFNHQISDYWQYSWASSKMIGLNDEAALAEILSQDIWKSESAAVHVFAEPYGDAGRQNARLYGATHTLVQSLLASAKLKPSTVRKSHNGEKCPLCGEHEVLHDYADAGKTTAVEYSGAVKKFWDELRSKYNSKDSASQIGKNERICAICASKRFMPLVMKHRKEELLHTVLGEAESFPSTTELAAKKYIDQLKNAGLLSNAQENDFIDKLHSAELDEKDDEYSKELKEIKELGKTKNISYTDRDKYYAVLLMDGDRMGDLVNGKTLSASWGDVLHPELKKRFASDAFCSNSPLKKVKLETNRSINPAVHAAISDSLNSFARYAVAPVIRKSGGRLIYAGGDDVCAMLPLDTALEAAEKISKAYKMTFVKYSADGAEEITAASGGKLGIHLGDAEGISISAALVIAHHKEPLKEVLRDAHAVLDGIAKKKTGRNALAVRLKKRSGGDRDISFKWDAVNPFLPSETLLQSFRSVMASVKDAETSSSLVYKMNQLKEAVRPLLKNIKDEDSKIIRLDIDEIARDRVVKLFAYEVGHSGTTEKCLSDDDKRKKKHQMAARLAGLCIQRNPSGSADSEWFNPEGPVIGRFLASRQEGSK